MNIGELSDAYFDSFAFGMYDCGVGRWVGLGGIKLEWGDECFKEGFGGDRRISENFPEPVESPYTTVLGKFPNGEQRPSS